MQIGADVLQRGDVKTGGVSVDRHLYARSERSIIGRVLCGKYMGGVGASGSRWGAHWSQRGDSFGGGLSDDNMAVGDRHTLVTQLYPIRPTAKKMEEDAREIDDGFQHVNIIMPLCNE